MKTVSDRTPEYERADKESYSESRFQTFTLVYDAACDLCPDLRVHIWRDVLITWGEIHSRSKKRAIAIEFKIDVHKHVVTCAIKATLHYENGAWSRIVLREFRAGSQDFLPGHMELSFSKVTGSSHHPLMHLSEG